MEFEVVQKYHLTVSENAIQNSNGFLGPWVPIPPLNIHWFRFGCQQEDDEIDIYLGWYAPTALNVTCVIAVNDISQKLDYSFGVKNGFHQFGKKSDLFKDGKMDLDAVLTIKFTRDMVRDLENNASHAVALLEDNEFKDFVFLVQGQEMKVHRNIIAVASPVFAAMLEPHTKESQEGKVEIEDFDHETVKAAVNLIYRRNLHDDLPVEILLNLFKFADKYDLVDKLKISGKIRENSDLSTVVQISKFSKANSFDGLYNASVAFFAENFEINTKNVKDFDDLDPGFVIDAVKKRYRPKEP